MERSGGAELRAVAGRGAVAGLEEVGPPPRPGPNPPGLIPEFRWPEGAGSGSPDRFSSGGSRCPRQTPAK